MSVESELEEAKVKQVEATKKVAELTAHKAELEKEVEEGNKAKDELKGSSFF